MSADPIAIDRMNLAWAAGLFEGEGSISRSVLRYDTKSGPHSYIRPMLSMSMLDRDRIELFHESVGGLGKFYTTNRASRVGQPPFYTWQTVKKEHVQAVMAFLWPWLGPRRRGRYKELVAEIGEGVLIG